MQGLGEAIDALFKIMTALLLVFVPLGAWKLVELINWAITHISIGVVK